MSNVVSMNEAQNAKYRQMVEQHRELLDTDPLSCFSSATLARVARGELDLNQMALVQLAQRGQDSTGQWVGFEKAHQAMMKAALSN